MTKNIIIFLIFILNFSLYSQNNEEIEFFVNKMYEVKNKKCNFSKKGLKLKTYNLEYTTITGYWKNNKIPYGEWIEKTYSDRIIKTQCYQKNEIFFKNYAGNNIVTTTYIDENIRIDGDFANENKLVYIIVFFHDNAKFSLSRIFFYKDGVWLEKDLSYPSILDLDLDTYLYLVDQERK